MKTRFITLFFFSIFFVAWAAVSFAAATNKLVHIKADIRYRWEYEDQFNQKFYGKDPPMGEADNGFLLQRIRFALAFHPKKNICISTGIQDSRAYNVALPDRAFYKPRLGLHHNPYKDYLEPFDTYLELKDLYGQGLDLKVGRQIIAYGDRRIFGPGQWGNTGRYIWDAAKISYRFGQDFIDAFYGANIIHDPERLSLGHRHFFQCLAIYSHFRMLLHESNLYLEPFLVRKFDNHDNFKGEDGKLGDFTSNYYGLRIYSRTLLGLDYDFTLVWQRGHWARDDLNAYGYHVMIGYRPKKVPWKLRVSTEFSYASGDKDPTDGSKNTFDGVFGARDKMYGRMNLMCWKNLQDAQINLESRPTKRLKLKVELHKFWLAQARDAWYLNQSLYRDKSGDSGRDLGWELDVVGRFLTPLKGLEVQIGYGHFWPGRFVKRMASNTEANWCFLQFHYRFNNVSL